ncbi:MAG: glutathione S-transferase family protein [Alphaproteobacteria bacterium]|jgi:glutathione S-transferase
MKLYDFIPAPNPARVRIFLAEKGVQILTEQVAIREGALQQEPFVTMNPMRTAPFLELDDGTVIAETMAICRYIEELNPTPPLFGRDAKERAVVEMWNRRLEMDAFAFLSLAARNSAPMFAGRVIAGMRSDHPQVPEMAARCREIVELFLPKLEARLTASAYVGGDVFTVADITGVFVIRSAKAQEMDLSACPSIERWFAEVSARPSMDA